MEKSKGQQIPLRLYRAFRKRANKVMYVRRNDAGTVTLNCFTYLENKSYGNMHWAYSVFHLSVLILFEICLVPINILRFNSWYLRSKLFLSDFNQTRNNLTKLNSTVLRKQLRRLELLVWSGRRSKKWRSQSVFTSIRSASVFAQEGLSLMDLDQSRHICHLFNDPVSR
jgi:hypothetical protein